MNHNLGGKSLNVRQVILGKRSDHLASLLVHVVMNGRFVNTFVKNGGSKLVDIT
jgi:hypothetical protein